MAERNVNALSDEVLKVLQKQIEQITVMLNDISIKNGRLLTDSERATLSVLKRRQESLLKRARENCFRVVLIGQEDVGRSSVANAILANDYLPTGDGCNTYTPTEIRFDPDAVEDKVEVFFYTEEEFDHFFQKKITALSYIQPAWDGSFASFNFETYAEWTSEIGMGTSLDEVTALLSNRESILANLRSGESVLVFTGEQLINRDFHQYISDPAFAPAVRLVSITSGQLSGLTNTILLDVPSYSSSSTQHLQETVQNMIDADAIIHVRDFRTPLLDDSDLRISEEYLHALKAIGMKPLDKIFIFLNKCDCFDSVAERDDFLSMMRADYVAHPEILSANTIRTHIYYGSANAVLQQNGMLRYADRDYAEQMTSKGFTTTGIADLVRDLQDYNITARMSTLRRQIRDTQEAIWDCLKHYLDQSEPDSDAYFYDFSEYLRNKWSCALTDFRDKWENGTQFSTFSSVLYDAVQKLKNSDIKIKEYSALWREIKINRDDVQFADMLMRDQKFKYYHAEFMRDVSVAVMRRRTFFYSELKSTFMETLPIKPSDFNRVSDALDSFLGKRAFLSFDEAGNPIVSPNDSYPILRTCDPLFSVLIRRPFGSDSRWNEFQNCKDRLRDLARHYQRNLIPFYSEKVEMIPPKDSMFFEMLFHKSRQELANQLVEQMMPNFTQTDSAVREAEFLSMLRQCAYIQLDNLYDFLPDEGPDGLVDFEEAYERMASELHQNAERVSFAKFFQIDPDYYRERNNIYLSEDCPSKMEAPFLGKTLDTVKEEFNADVDLLIDILSDAADPAVGIHDVIHQEEKHFLEHQYASLNDMQHFGRFIVDMKDVFAADVNQRAELKREALKAIKDAYRVVEQPDFN